MDQKVFAPDSCPQEGAVPSIRRLCDLLQRQAVACENKARGDRERQRSCAGRRWLADQYACGCQATRGILLSQSAQPPYGSLHHTATACLPPYSYSIPSAASYSHWLYKRNVSTASLLPCVSYFSATFLEYWAISQGGCPALSSVGVLPSNNNFIRDNFESHVLSLRVEHGYFFYSFLRMLVSRAQILFRSQDVCEHILYHS